MDLSTSASFWASVYETFLASIRSVGTACTLAACGTYMHQRGIISTTGKRMMALISQQVTFPLFLFTKIIYCNQDWSKEECPSVTASLKQVWMLLLWPLVTVGAGMLVGWLVSRVTKTPHSQQKSVMAAVAFGNSTGLPITLLTVVHTNFSKSSLGRVDPTLFLSVYLLLYPVLQWGLGGWLLAPTKEEEAAAKKATEQDSDLEKQDSDKNAENSTATSSTNRSSPPLSSIITEPVLETCALDSPHNGADGFLQPLAGEGAAPPIHSVRSSFKINVLNNPTVKDELLRHRQGLYSTDEGMYLSDMCLSAMGGNSPSQENLYYLGSEQQQQEYARATGLLHPASFGQTQTQQQLSYQQQGMTNPDNDDADSNDQPEFLLYDDSPEQTTQASSSQASSGGDDVTRDGEKPTEEEAHDEKQPLLSSQPEEETERTLQAGNGSTYGTTVEPTRAGRGAGQPPAHKDDKAHSASEYKGDSVWVTLGNIAERCFQPPVIGAITGILVAISPLRGLFVDLVDRDADAPLEWLFDGLYSVGLTAVPINMIILGCNLSNSYNKFVAERKKAKKDSTDDNGKPKDSHSKNKEGLLNMTTMVGIVIGKMIVMPLVGFLSVIFLDLFVLDIPDDISAAFYLVMLIVFLTPTANNVMVMVELSGSNTKEGIANVIALQYAVAPIILSCTMTVAIGYAQSLEF